MATTLLCTTVVAFVTPRHGLLPRVPAVRAAGEEVGADKGLLRDLFGGAKNLAETTKIANTAPGVQEVKQGMDQANMHYAAFDSGAERLPTLGREFGREFGLIIIVGLPTIPLAVPLFTAAQKECGFWGALASTLWFPGLGFLAFFLIQRSSKWASLLTSATSAFAALLLVRPSDETVEHARRTPL